MGYFTAMKITALQGIGEAKGKAFARLGIQTVGDLLYHYPRVYENRGDVRLLSECQFGEKHSVILTVSTAPRAAQIRRGMSILKFRAFDDSDVCEIVYFNQDYLKSSFSVGATFRFFGKVDCDRGKIVMSSPAFEPYRDGVPLPPFTPLYSWTEGLSQKQVTQCISTALSLGAAEIRDFLPEEIRLKHKLCTRQAALRGIHFPESFASLAAAKKRLIFDELFTFALGISLAGEREKRSSAYPCKSTDMSALLRLLPYSLTSAQARVIGEIRADMEKDTSMSRIVIGDVGCGKTVCAAAAMLFAVQSGHQAALLAPTEILARQHYLSLCEIFEKMGIKCELLLGAAQDICIVKG